MGSAPADVSVVVIIRFLSFLFSFLFRVGFHFFRGRRPIGELPCSAPKTAAERQISRQPFRGRTKYWHIYTGQKGRLLQLFHEEEVVVLIFVIFPTPTEPSNTTQEEQLLPGDGDAASQEIRTHG